MVTISKPGFTFSPASKNYTSVTSDLAGEDYTATRFAYAILGNAGVAGAKLSYHDGINKTVIADSKGDYAILLPLNWSGTVTASLTNYRFIPANKVYPAITADIPAQNYAAYALVPTTLLPLGPTFSTTPIYTWSKIFGATKYQLDLWKGSALVYSLSLPTSWVCPATTCKYGPYNKLMVGATYKWRVRAMVNGIWYPYSAYKVYNIPSARSGYWKGYGLDFYVAPAGNKVQNFSIYIQVSGCGSYKITYTKGVVISQGKFAFAGHFYTNGTFYTMTSTSGLLGLSNFYIPGCGYIKGGPFAWKATWKKALSQSADTFMPAEVTETLLLPAGVDPSLGDYTVERVGP